MAELAGSIIGIVSAGTKVALVLSQLAADVGSAGQEARMIGSEIRSFCAVLKTLGNTLEKLQDSSYYTHCFEMVRDMTDASLEMFTEILNAVESLRHMTAGKDGKDGKFGLVGKVQWVVFQKPKLLVLRAAIEAYKSNLALMLGTLEVTEKVARRMSMSIDSDVSGQEKQERALLESLSLDHRSSLIMLVQAEQKYTDGQSDHEHAVIRSALEEAAPGPGASPQASAPIASAVIDEFFEEAREEVSSLRHSLPNNTTSDAVRLQAQATEHSNRLSSLIETDQRRLSERWSNALVSHSNVAMEDSLSSVVSAAKSTRDTPEQSWIKSEARNDVKYQAIRAWISKHPPKTRRLILAALKEDTSTRNIRSATVAKTQKQLEQTVELVSNQMMHQWAEFVQNCGPPVDITEVKNLMVYHINLDAQGLYDMPSEAIYAISRERTRSLTLTRNHLNTLPSTLCLCSQLTSLDLGQNKFEVVPDAIRSIPKLQALDLRNNNLRSIPNWIVELADLQVLSLSNNQIQGIPFAVGQMKMLEVLDLVGNPIVTPSEYMVNLMSSKVDDESDLDQRLRSLPAKRDIVANKHRTQRVKAALRFMQNASVSSTDAQAIAGTLSEVYLNEALHALRPLWPMTNVENQPSASLEEVLSVLLKYQAPMTPPTLPKDATSKLRVVVSPTAESSGARISPSNSIPDHTRSRSQDAPTRRSPVSPVARERKANRNSSVYGGMLLGEPSTSGGKTARNRLTPGWNPAVTSSESLWKWCESIEGQTK